MIHSHPVYCLFAAIRGFKKVAEEEEEVATEIVSPFPVRISAPLSCTALKYANRSVRFGTRLSPRLYSTQQCSSFIGESLKLSVSELPVHNVYGNVCEC